MASQSKVTLKGSQKAAPVTAPTHTLNQDEISEITVRIRRKKSLDDLLLSGEQISEEVYEAEYGASQQDADEVIAFAAQYNLTMVETDLSRRTVIFSGTLADLQDAFEVELKGYSNAAGNNFRGRTGAICIPADLQNVIEGVFGLDNRPLARPMFKVAQAGGAPVDAAAKAGTFTADKLAKIYGFPQDVNGSGECIAIIELGGGYKDDELTTFFTTVGIKPQPVVTTVLVDKGTNNPTTPQSADGEVMLDIEVAGAVAPGANIVVYFSPNTDKGFLDSITTAIHNTANKPSVVSISWGSAEVNWTQQSLTNFNEAFKTAGVLGVTICVAAGDSGSADSVTDGKVHVDFPASSPYVLACGGTRLIVNADGSITETVWHDSDTSAGGGGVSEVFPLPAYQANANVPPSVSTRFKGRGVPDVAANADPDSGYKVLVDTQIMVVGGTSAVAPLMAGLIALVNEQKGTKAGFINPKLYATPGVCRDITVGDNKTTSTGLGYTAGPGWDACTGLGVFSGF